MHLLDSLLYKIRKKNNNVFDADIQPDERLFVIGDVHGRADLLLKLLEKAPEEVRKVFVGDLIDRGEESAEVLSIVHKLCGSGAVCVMGNHEKMMLDFLNRPEKNFRTWMRYGGFQTLQSFGVLLNKMEIDANNFEGIKEQLCEALPNDMESWLRNLPTHWSSGNVHIVHAAADPEVAMDRQNNQVLYQGCPNFFHKARKDSQWIVHGHTIVDHAVVEAGRIAVDTGAYLSERLTGVLIAEKKIDFIVV